MVVARRGERHRTQQPTDLVTAQHPPRSVGASHRSPQPVGVGVIGDEQAGAGDAGARDTRVEHARLFRVRKGQTREVGVGPELFVHQSHVFEARSREQFGHGLAAHAE